jgi:hypothetical protein
VGSEGTRDCGVFIPIISLLVRLLHSSSTGRNPTETQPVPSVDNIKEIADFLVPEDAIMMARDKIACLDDMSLEGDLPDDVWIAETTGRKVFFRRVKSPKR